MIGDEVPLRDEDAVFDAIKSVVTERGLDFVYPRAKVAPGDRFANCVYREPQTGQPSCLVGLVLEHWGLLDYYVPPNDDDGYGAEEWLHNSDAVSDLGLEEVTYEGVHLLQVAQYAQDHGLRYEQVVDVVALARDTHARYEDIIAQVDEMRPR